MDLRGFIGIDRGYDEDIMGFNGLCRDNMGNNGI
jgi:hypothetical protein